MVPESPLGCLLGAQQLRPCVRLLWSEIAFGPSAASLNAFYNSYGQGYVWPGVLTTKVVDKPAHDMYVRS